jgi:hypothetical protein
MRNSSFRLVDISNEPLTLGLLLCWLTNKSSSFCYYQQQFGQTQFYSTFVLNFIISNSIGLHYRAGRYKIPAQQQALLVACDFPAASRD